MRDAVIVSTARTAIGKAYRGGFNATSGPTLGSYSLAAAVERAGIEGGEIDDVLWGSALQQGTQAGNLARQVVLARRTANYGFGHDDGSPVLIRPDVDRNRCQANHRR